MFRLGLQLTSFGTSISVHPLNVSLSKKTSKNPRRRRFENFDGSKGQQPFWVGTSIECQSNVTEIECIERGQRGRVAVAAAALVLGAGPELQPAAARPLQRRLRLVLERAEPAAPERARQESPAGPARARFARNNSGIFHRLQPLVFQSIGLLDEP